MALDTTNFDSELMELRRRLGFQGEPIAASGLTDDQLPDLQSNNQPSFTMTTTPNINAIPTASSAPADMPEENGGEQVTDDDGPSFFGTLADVGKGMPGDYEDPRSIMVKEIIAQYRTAARDDLLREDAELRKAVNDELNLRMAARRGEVPPAPEDGGGFFGIQKLLTRQ